MCARFIRQQEECSIELLERLAVALLVEHPLTLIEVELREILLIPLAAGGQRRLDSRRVRQFDIAFHALETAGHRVCGGTLVELGVSRREAPRQLPLAIGFGREAGLRERRGQYVVCVSIRGVAADRFAQPMDRGWRIALEPVGVAEIE